jgi:hypothetical protein
MPLGRAAQRLRPLFVVHGFSFKRLTRARAFVRAVVRMRSRNTVYTWYYRYPLLLLLRAAAYTNFITQIRKYVNNESLL